MKSRKLDLSQIVNILKDMREVDLKDKKTIKLVAHKYAVSPAIVTKILTGNAYNDLTSIRDYLGGEHAVF